MRYRSYGLATPKRVVMYCFYVILVVWFLSTVVLGYQFLMKNSKTTTKKWGTFVEAIFNEVSYLPYLKNDWQSMFYQSFFVLILVWTIIESMRRVWADLFVLFRQAIIRPILLGLVVLKKGEVMESLSV